MARKPTLGDFTKTTPYPRSESRLALATADFDELAEAFRGWNHRFRQLSKGRFEGCLRVVGTGSLELSHVATNQVIQARGARPSGSYVFVPVTEGNAGSIWRGRMLRPGHVVVLGPQDEMDHQTAKPYSSYFMTVDGGFLRAKLNALLGPSCAKKLDGKLAVSSTLPRCEAFCRLVATIHDERRENTAERVEPTNAAHFEETCLTALARLMAPIDGVGPIPASSFGRAALVTKAEEIMEAHVQLPLTILELCHELDTSERTLHYAFQEIHAMSPKAYCKTKRLNGVRQELKSCRGGGATISQIAVGWGFPHPGNFAADYRQLFGEAPSQTRGRERGDQRLPERQRDRQGMSAL